MNKLLSDFSLSLERRFSKAYADQSMLDWISQNTTLGGMPFSTKGREFQNAIINDMHPNLSVIKCSQIGLTEVQIRKALGFVNRNRGVAAIFTLPNEALYRRVSQTRIKPIVDKTKSLNLEQDEKSVRSMAILQFDTSFLYITACTEGDATSTAADAIFNDEVDLSPQDMLALFSSRLQGSDFRITQQFSTPTFQEFGIDAGYKVTDRRRYLHHCDACGHWNWPEFNTKFCRFPDLPSHIEELTELDQETVDAMDLTKCFVACEQCGGPLDPKAKREWVATFPGRTNARGYWVTPFSTIKLTLPYIVGQLLRYKKRDYLRGFYNTVLGQTYSDSKTQITLESVERAMAKGTPNVVELPRDVPLALGCDMGQTCHLVIGQAGTKKIFAMETVPADRIEARIKYIKDNYRLVTGAVDRLPYTPTAEAIMRSTDNVVIPVQYATGKDSDMKLVLDQYELLSHAHMNRTKILDEVQAGFREFEWELSGYGHQKQVVIDHYRDMVRKEEPEKPASWEKLTGNDHYFHATALFLAAQKLRPLVVEQLNKGVGDMFGFGSATFTMNHQAALPGAETSGKRQFGLREGVGFQRFS